MNKKNDPIGIFDSGLGGLTTVKAVREALPQEDIIYFGDTARVPYGNRSRETLIRYVTQDIRLLLRFGVKAVVIACNTADSMAREEMIKRFYMPIVGVVDPAAKAAAQATRNGRIGVIGTNATIASGIYERLIPAENPSASVFCVPTPLLVPLVESGRIRKGDDVTENVLREYLLPLREKEIDTLVLGCTHYPLLTGIIEDILPGVTLINSGSTVTEKLKTVLAEKDLLTDNTAKGTVKYFVSDAPEVFAEHGGLFIGDSIASDVTRIEIE